MGDVPTEWMLRNPLPTTYLKVRHSSRLTPFFFGLSAINLESAGWQMSSRDRFGSMRAQESPLPKIPIS
jgi:hypothetical protein